MTIATVAYALVFGSLVAAAAAALDACLRLGKRATRGVWLAALGVTLAGTALAPARTLVPAAPAAAGVAVSATVPNTSSLVDRVVQSFVTVRFVALHLADRALARIPAAHIPSLDRSLTVVWIAVSFALLALLIAVHVHFRRARRAWPVTTVDGTKVRLAPRTGPAVIGLIDPEIVVPTWLITRATVEQRLVLDHEREHLRARDPLLLSAAYVAATLMPWHPGVWWMLARLRLAVELDCDTRVLRRGVPAGSYGALLIDLADRGAAATGVPALGLTLTNLERRLIAMTPHRRPHSSVRRGLLAAAALLAFAIACNAPVPTSPHQVNSLSVPVHDKMAGLLTPGDSVVYHIDGMLASALQADSLRVYAVPRTMLIQAQVGKDIRKRVELWITTERAKQEAAHLHIDALAPVVNDRSEALLEKMQVDSALAAMIHMKRSAKFTGSVLSNDRTATMLALKQLPPDLIKSIAVMKHADSTSAIKVITKDH
jgi:beta-lactamase regulating signal transducer with metallopeptidase domain